MDIKWFKDQQKKAGVTGDDIAREMGRARSNVSNILHGQQKMSLDWARAFAKVLGVPLDEVLLHAGVMAPKEARPMRPGFAESDAAIFQPKGAEAIDMQDKLRAFGLARGGVDVWTVKGTALTLAGYLPGDRIAVDSHQSERCKAGDIVLAQRYDAQTATAITMLRRYEPPVLVAASCDPSEQRIHVVDTDTVVIMGRVVASWREIPARAAERQNFNPD